MNITSLVYAVHPIDISSNQVEKSSIPDEADLQTFVKQLISSPLLENENRKFHWPSDTALVPSLLKNMVSNIEEYEDAAQTLAERLHEKENDAQRRVERMDVQVQKGSLIQIMFKRDAVPCILLVKIHLAPFLGETDYKRHNGYPLEDTVLKMCFVEFDDKNVPATVAVADSNARLSEYWWKEFLELAELTSDEFNTKTAFNAMDALLTRKLKTEHRADFYQLRNNLIGYFRTKTQYNHSRMLDYVFGDYKPADTRVEIDELVVAAKTLPAKHKFDSRFKIDSDSINKKKRTIIALTPQIDLELKDAIESLPETIFAGVLGDGTQGVFIRSTDGFEYFKIKDPSVVTAE